MAGSNACWSAASRARSRPRRELVLLHVTTGEGVKADEELARDLYAAGVRGLGDEPGRPALDLNVRLAVEDGDPVQVLAAVGREEAAALLGGPAVALVPESAGESPAGSTS